MSRRQSRLACVFPAAEEQAVDGHSRQQTPSYRAASSGSDDLIDLSDIGCADCSVDSLSNKSKVGGIPIDSVKQGAVCLRNSHLMQTDGNVVCGGGDQTVTWATWGQATSWKGDPLCHPVHNRDVQGHPVPLTRGGHDTGVQGFQVPVTRVGYQGGHDTGVQGFQVPVMSVGYQGGHDTGVQGFQIPVTSVGYEGHATSIPGYQLPVINVGSVTVNGRHKRQAVWPRTSSIPVRSADLGVSNMETDYVQPDKRHPAEQGSVNAGNDHWSPGKYGAVGGSEGQHNHSVDPPASQGSKRNHRIESDSLLQMIPNGQEDYTVDTPFTMKDIMGEFRSNMNWSMTSSGMTSNSSEDSFFISRTNLSKGLRIDEIPAKMQTEMKAVLSDCKLKSTVACEGIGDTGTPSNLHEALGGRDPAGEADVSEEASLMKMMSNMKLDGWHSHSQTANGVTCNDIFTTGNDKERKKYCLKVDESHAGIHSASHGDNTAESTTHNAHGIQSGRHFPVLDAADVTGVSRREMDRSERDKNVMGKSEKDQSELGTSEMGRKELGTSEMGRKELGTSEMRRKELGTSKMGRKELGTSKMGSSQLGKSEMEQSEMGRSEIGEREFGKNKMGRSEPYRSELGKSVMGRGEMGISETGLAQIDKIMKDVHRRGRSQKGIQDFDEIKTEKREQAERITDTERELQHCAGAAEQIRSSSSLPLLEDPPHIQLEMDERVKIDEFLNMKSKYQPINPASIMVEDCSDEDSSQFCKRPLPFEQTGVDTVTETVGQILLDKQRMPLARHLEKDIFLGNVDHMSTLALPFGNAAGCSSLKRNQNLTVNRASQDKSAMAVSVNRSNNVQAVGNLNYNKNIFKMSTGEGYHNIRTQSLREIASNEKLFVQTEAFHEVWKVSKEENVVFIVGPPGAGKTMIAKAVLLKLRKEQDFEPLILLSVQEMREALNIDEKQGIFIKNTFGVSDFDQAKLNLLLEYFASVSVCVSGNKRFIFTCNNRIFTKCRPYLKLKKFFTASSVVDVKQVGGLTVSDKRTILYTHLKQRDVILPDDLVDKIVNCANNSTLAFPKCCEIFTKSPYLHDQGKSVKFFQKPVLYYKLSAQLLWQKDDKSYFIVLLLVMVLGELQDSFLKDVLEDSLILKKAEKVLAMLPYEVTLTQLESATKDLLNEGLYLKRSENNDSFIFIDSCVCDAVAIVFGTEYPKQLLQICSGEFLCERVLVNSQSKEENDEGNFPIRSGHFDFLSERFVTEIRSGSPYLVTRHQALGDGSFIKSFANYCETKTDINSILKSKDNLHQFPLLFWSSWNEKEHLFRWIFHEHKKRKLPISKEDIKRIARACCISGNVGALKIVFKVVKSSSDMVEDCATMSLAMPTCSEASLTVSPVEGVVQVGGLLNTACLHGHLPVVELLVTEYHSPVDLHDHYDNTPLTIAAKHGHANIVKFLIDQGAKAKIGHQLKKMAIHEACENGRTEVVKVLLTAWPKLVDVIGPAPDLRFPIHYACASKEPQLVKLLVEKGAVPKCVDSTNNTAFHTACCRPGGLRVLKELKPTLQDLKLQNKFLATCLHLACEFGGPAMVEFLIKKGADVNALNNKKQTSLHVACQRNHVAIAEKLLKNGADVFALDITKKPALKLTTHKKLQKFLIEQMNESDKVNQK
ncbi:uncharacterized protein LOC124262793 isoform X2 [Haliotis rubra]|uniref:uncharacterized protein LOC124262793 isoform X2 n=1 Tax=Haliotis rubra TaxID=36100 RepID=UPI001EE52842|nr:uncharacterized protein LOC124262793 isoform X2 [Haliotis rubra]